MPWTRKLTRPLTVPDGPTLTTLADARAYILEQHPHFLKRDEWLKVSRLMLNVATGDDRDIEALTDALSFALSLSATRTRQVSPNGRGPEQ